MEDQKGPGGRAGGREPLPGEGIRSLHTWKCLSAARKALAEDGQARQRLADDPVAFLADFGVEERFLEVFLHPEPPPAPAPQVRDLPEDDPEDDYDDADGVEAAKAPGAVVRSQGGRISLRIL